jgi:hypothetical protein
MAPLWPVGGGDLGLIRKIIKHLPHPEYCLLRFILYETKECSLMVELLYSFFKLEAGASHAEKNTAAGIAGRDVRRRG